MSAKSILISTLFTAFGLCSALIILEVAVRLFDLNKSPLPNWNDRPKRYYYRWDATDARGNPPIVGRPDKDTTRIAVIGDSFSFAPYMQVDDAFPAKLDRMLNFGSNTHKFEVINYGVPRYSTSHEIKLVERALAEHANLIILQITLNDPEIKPYIPTGLINSDRFGQPKLDSGIFKYWQTVKFLASRYYALRSNRQYKDYFFTLWEGKKTSQNYTDSINKITQLSRTKGIPIVAVIFPLFGFPNDSTYPFHPLHKKAAEPLTTLAVPYIDLFEAYKNIPLERLVVLPGRDRHPNEIAHRIAAEEIYSWLQTLPLSTTISATHTPNRISILFQNNKDT